MKSIYIVSIYDSENRMQVYNIAVAAPPGMDAWNKAITEAQRLAGVPTSSAPQTCQLSHATVHAEVA